MLNIKTNPKLFVALAFGGFLTAMALYGCSSNQDVAATQQSIAPTTQPASFALFGPAPKRSGVQLWSDTCARCHNSRPPEEFSDAQWGIIVHHMQLRANLTGEEAREITKFLQASN
jgi:cytochrome c5